MGISNADGTVARLRAVPATARGGDRECISVLAELLGASGVPDPAVKARRLVNEFGSLSAVLAAAPEAQARVLGADTKAVRGLGATRAAMLHALKSEAVGRPIFSSAEALIDYLKLSLAGATEEQLRVLFLNARNQLMKEELTFPGSTTGVVIRPRAIIRRALELGATAIILVHNHPSGDPTPSADDIRATAALVAAADPLEIVVHDHIIVGEYGWTSLKSSGLMRQAA